MLELTWKTRVETTCTALDIGFCHARCMISWMIEFFFVDFATCPYGKGHDQVARRTAHERNRRSGHVQGPVGFFACYEPLQVA